MRHRCRAGRLELEHEAGVSGQPAWCRGEVDVELELGAGCGLGLSIRARGGNDLGAELGVGGEYAVVAHHVRPGRRNHGADASDEVERLEHERRRSVAPCEPPQAALHRLRPRRSPPPPKPATLRLRPIAAQSPGNFP
jgi:hypothetical protein